MEANKNTRLDELFNQAKHETPKVSYGETKRQFLSSVGKMKVSSTSKKQLLTLKNIIIMSSTIGIIAIGTIILVNKLLAPTNQTLAKEELKTTTHLILKKHDKIITGYISNVKFIKGSLPIKEPKKIIKNLNYQKPFPFDTLKKVRSTVNYHQKTTKIDTSYRFLVLTAKEIAENNKRKKTLSKLNRKNIPFGFVFIPKGEVRLGNKTIKSEAFYIKQTEVSNLEYRTFLFDLLIQGRKDEFLTAKPNQTKWNKYDKNMKDSYFSNEKYNDYPVVNISRKGAELYCKWLSGEINKSQQKRLKGLIALVRLPLVNEWMYAASGGKNNAYGWDLEARQNSLGCFLANFKYNPKMDTIKFTGCEIKDINAKTTSGLILGENSYTTKVYSYNANNYKLYCVSGNVAEMVNYPNGSIGTKGGSWNSTGENIKILAPDEFKGVNTANVNIGFRPIITL